MKIGVSIFATEYAIGVAELARAGDLGAGIADLRQRAARAGRDPNSLTVTVFGTNPDEAVLRGYEKTGVERALFGLPSANRETILPLLDRYAPLVRAFK